MIELALRAAREAGYVLKEHFRRPHAISHKGLRDITTEADLAAEKTTLRIIRDGCPGARFVSEESYHQVLEYGDQPTWYIDPLDGTTNFARGLSIFSVSVAMARNGIVECGAVYDPLLDQMFHAERGEGAFLNGQALHVSTKTTLAESLVLLDWPRAPEPRQTIARYLSALVPLVDAVRSHGSAALGLCEVAAGWADGYYQLTLKPWDVAAGVLILEEAGGRVTSLSGAPHRLEQEDWLATNGAIHAALLAAFPLEGKETARA